MKRDSGCCVVDIYCTAALTSISDSISYITYLFSEWRIFTIVGYCEKSNQPITQPDAPDRVSVVCLMHDTRHKQLQWYNCIGKTISYSL